MSEWIKTKNKTQENYFITKSLPKGIYSFFNKCHSNPGEVPGQA